MPTSSNSNARGVDTIAYSQDGTRKITVQVKALSKKNPVPMGGGARHLIADYLVIARCVWTDSPEFFIAASREIAGRIHVGRKNGKESHWLQPKDYSAFAGRWEVIGSGNVVPRSSLRESMRAAIPGRTQG
jgi:hypothetical protein